MDIRLFASYSSNKRGQIASCDMNTLQRDNRGILERRWTPAAQRKPLGRREYRRRRRFLPIFQHRRPSMNSRGRKGRHSLLTHAQTEQALRRPSERSRRRRSGRGGRGRAPGRRGRRRQPRPSRRMDSPSEWGPWGRGLGRLAGGTGAAGGLWAERGGLGGEGEGGARMRRPAGRAVELGGASRIASINTQLNGSWPWLAGRSAAARRTGRRPRWRRGRD